MLIRSGIIIILYFLFINPSFADPVKIEICIGGEGFVKCPQNGVHLDCTFKRAFPFNVDQEAAAYLCQQRRAAVLNVTRVYSYDDTDRCGCTIDTITCSK